MSYIRVDGDTVPVDGNATFRIFVRSERVNIQDGRWQDEPMVGVRYDFEVVVDEQSGEDVALAPTASLRALHEDTFVPRLPVVGGELVLEPHEGRWEGVLGNDSWPLERNRIVIAGFDGRAARLVWTAVYGRQGEHSFLFEGGADFTGIFVWADLEADLDRAIAGRWPGSTLSDLEKTNVRVDESVDPPRWSALYRFR